MISEVYNEDCMLGMARYPDKFFELAIVDPPYGINEDGGAQRTRKSQRTNGVKKNWDTQIPDDNYFNELFRVSKNQIIWGGNYFYLDPTKCFIIWDKLDYGSDFADCEFAWASFYSASKIYKQSRQSNQTRTGNIRFHPTQKPIKLYKWLLKNYAKEGDKILDTHLGSQSSRIAAYDMGFDFYGWELDEDYFKDGCKRFENHKKQLTIFQY